MSVYAVSDLHGMYSLYEKICEKLNPEDRVIFLGDAGDRGPESWRLIRAILDNPQWYYLKGNHEDMLVKAVDEIKEFDEGLYGEACWLCRNNGGGQTLEDCLKDNEGFEIIEQLRALPLSHYYRSPSEVEYCCTHAGYTPTSKNRFPHNDSQKLLWDRNHISDTDFPVRDNFYIIHGHTPVEYSYDYAFDGDFMDRKYNSPYLYGNGMKIDIDAGSFYTYQTYLFNLDEFSFEVIGNEDYDPNEE